MHTDEYAKMEEQERFYWWYVGRRHIIATILKKFYGEKSSVRLNILDAGCGTGGTAELLSSFGVVTGIEKSEDALRRAETKSFVRLVKGSVTKTPFQEAEFDLVVLLDVLEHVGDDDAVLREVSRIAKAGGGFLLTVPAYQWLWSGHDEALGHKRRYRLRELERRIDRAGFRIGFGTYGVSILFPAIVLYRTIDRVFRRKPQMADVHVSRPLNALFILLLQIEACCMRMGIRFPFGTSVVIHAQKRVRRRAS